MLERDLYENYRISQFNMTEYKGYKAFSYQGNFYVIVPVNGLEQEELLELKQMSDYLQYQREHRIAVFVPTITQELVASVNQQMVVLLKLNEQGVRNNNHSSGALLANFHKKGRFLPNPPQKSSRIGQWKTYWERRLDQLEKFWAQKLKDRPANKFEKVFFETFPYYLGLTENAIQYIADCQYEDQRNEIQVGTICYVRFKPKHAYDPVIFPTDLVYDHPSRDLAEWVRHYYLEGERSDNIIKFFNDYQQIYPLSETSWKLVYGRLLFPVTYFESIEGYYSAATQARTDSYERKFLELVERADQYEQFLSSFYPVLGLPVEKLRIPELDWLKNKRVKI
ncbi:spore coat putative kinase YutH [Bacillus sp. Marseille-P3661]|uniref:spore coat putative kinase YutH n=1 Tax=Bacillus sp. Marseille-P3661 TaxID=1936234 RepID=UPI000C83E606|nr:spore coat protein YutH [Bacillus sp. Marseille-P3661]